MLSFKLTKEENRKLSVDSLSKTQAVRREEGSSRKEGIGLLLERLDFDWSTSQSFQGRDPSISQICLSMLRVSIRVLP